MGHGQRRGGRGRGRGRGHVGGRRWGRRSNFLWMRQNFGTKRGTITLASLGVFFFVLSVVLYSVWHIFGSMSISFFALAMVWLVLSVLSFFKYKKNGANQIGGGEVTRTVSVISVAHSQVSTHSTMHYSSNQQQTSYSRQQTNTTWAPPPPQSNSNAAFPPLGPQPYMQQNMTAPWPTPTTNVTFDPNVAPSNGQQGSFPKSFADPPPAYDDVVKNNGSYY